MALIATVTKDILTVIKERLSLKDPVLIGLSPSQPNITYKIERLPSLSLVILIVLNYTSHLRGRW